MLNVNINLWSFIVGISTLSLLYPHIYHPFIPTVSPLYILIQDTVRQQRRSSTSCPSSCGTRESGEAIVLRVSHE